MMYSILFWKVVTDRSIGHRALSLPEKAKYFNLLASAWSSARLMVVNPMD